MKIPERRHWGRSGTFIFKFELFQIFAYFSRCWFWTGKYLLRKLSDILYVLYLFSCVYWRKAKLNKKQCTKFRYFSYSHTQCDVTFANVDFEQVNICWENYLTFYMCDICFNVSIGERQNLTRSNARNSVVFLISHTQCDVTFASLQLLR